MAQLSRDAPNYEAAGVRVFAISSQSTRSAERWLAANPQLVPWLVDDDRAVIKRYGVYNRLSYDAWKMAHPAAVLIDRGGEVRFIYRASHQFDIPTSAVMLGSLERLG